MQTSRAPLALLALLLSASPSHAGNNSPAHSPADEKAIEQVVESFRTSLINKDKPTYMSLFFSDKPEDFDPRFTQPGRMSDLSDWCPPFVHASQTR